MDMNFEGSKKALELLKIDMIKYLKFLLLIYFKYKKKLNF